MANGIDALQTKKSNPFTQIGKTLTAVSLGLQGKDPSSVFDDDQNLSSILQQAQLAQMAGQPDLAQDISSAGLGIGQREKQRTVKTATGTVTLENIEDPNVEGRREGVKAASKEKGEKAAKATQAAARQDRVVKAFLRSTNELEKLFPEVGESTLEGFFSRVGAQGAEKLGLVPETTRAVKRLLVAANKQAREVEGGRVTDEDRKIYSEAMANALGAPTSSNIGLAADSLIDLYEEYDNSQDFLNIMKSYFTSEVPLLNKIGMEAIDIGGLGEEIIKNMSKEELRELSPDQLRILIGE